MGILKETLVAVVLVTKLCPTLCDPVDCSPPGSSDHEIFQTRILEWVVIPFPGHLPDPGIEPASLTLADGSFIFEPLGKPIRALSLSNL